MILKKDNIINFILIIIFKLLLEFSYIYVINPVWGYYGFSLNINYLKLFESYLWVLVIYIFLPKKEDKVSYLVIKFTYIVTVIPILSIYALKNESSQYLRPFIISYLITVLIVNYHPRIKAKNKIVGNNKMLFSVILLVYIYTYFSMIRVNGLPNFQLLDISKVYEYRFNIGYPLFTRYLVPWQAKVINPFLIALFYNKRNYNKMSLIIVNQIVLYMLTSHKGILFSPLLVVGVLYLINKGDFLKRMLIGINIIIIICLVVYTLNLSIWPVSLVVNRTFFLPAQIEFQYHDFFSKNPKLYLSEGQIGKLLGINSPYNMRAFNIIGDVYYNNPRTAANTGYLADAFSNLGYLGMIFYSIILGLILIFIDSISVKLPIQIVLATIIYPIMSLNDSSLLTVLLTHGLIVAIIVLLFYNCDVEGKIRKENHSNEKISFATKALLNYYIKYF